MARCMCDHRGDGNVQTVGTHFGCRCNVAEECHCLNAQGQLVVTEPMAQAKERGIHTPKVPRPVVETPCDVKVTWRKRLADWSFSVSAEQERGCTTRLDHGI